MKQKGAITRSQKRGLKILLSAHILWLGTICALGAWWGTLVLKQASKIAELEEQNGLAFTLAHAQWLKTQRMLYWESGTYFALLTASTVFLFWVYWRDAKRTRSLQAFFASMTHELRTPLTSIRLQAESIADASPQELNASQKLLVERLLEDTQRLELQVERVLELSRVEGGGPIFTRSIQTRPLLERMIRDWQSHQDGRAQVQLEAQDLQIEADPVAMHVILKNLLENSVRHSKQSPVKIEISTEQDSSGVILHFKDNGQSFSGNPKRLGLLFEKGETSQGAGVGLYLIQALMKRMGGLARFSSSNGGFEVALTFKEASHG